MLLGAAEVLEGHGLGHLTNTAEELVEEHMKVALEQLVGVEELEIGSGATEDALRSRQRRATGLEPGEIVLDGAQEDRTERGNVRDRRRNSTTSAGSIEAR